MGPFSAATVGRLALLSIAISALAAGVPSSVEEIKARLRNFQSQSVEVSNEVRRLSHALHPSVIQDFGLSTALEEFCEEFRKAHGIDVGFHAPEDGDTGLTADDASCLYRIAQACLQNIARHAHATEVSVWLTASGANLQLIVKDNGVGFHVEADRPRSCLGLISMQERIRIARGTFSITSRPGRGTVIVASVPLAGSST